MSQRQGNSLQPSLKSGRQQRPPKERAQLIPRSGLYLSQLIDLRCNEYIHKTHYIY